MISSLPADTTAALLQVIETMAALAENVPVENPSILEIEDWLASARSAVDSVVRKSLEMRVVALLLPNIWPFNRVVSQ